MSTAIDTAPGTAGLLRTLQAGMVMLFFATCSQGAMAAESALLHVQSNLSAASCEIKVGGDDKVKVRSAIPEEFATINTAGMLGFQVLITNCSGVDTGRTYGIKVEGNTLTGHPDIFNEDSSDDVGFMLKENRSGNINYWPGTKASFYTDPGTVRTGSESWADSVTSEKDPQQIQLNYFVGVVAPVPGSVKPGPRAVKANLTFTFMYH
ncbi:fimbrial protein [Enterobacter asburiae]|uniref:fimbrial protein n=1 Tax=Enterobacter asburiae TaxID=61645 RepID=UPI000F89833C|nr:fimbrial protein [Enterobacter asburiae]RTP87930.1 hypothetical protein EKN34_13485 [Enterobacter asburiae]